MHNGQRRIVALFLSLLLVSTSLVFAAGKGEAGGRGDEVVFWHYSSGLQGEAMNSLVDKFNATIGRQAGIVVRPIYQGKATDVSTKLRASLQVNR
ncbi:MAG: ABC transporter substrate-binding protein, partial [Sphaerochaetaceae bacterium]